MLYKFQPILKNICPSSRGLKMMYELKFQLFIQNLFFICIAILHVQEKPVLNLANSFEMVMKIYHLCVCFLNIEVCQDCQEKIKRKRTFPEKMLQHRHFVVMLYHSKNFRELWKHSKMLDHRHSLTEGATEMFSLNKALRLITHKLQLTHNLISLEGFLNAKIQSGQQRDLRKARHVKQNKSSQVYKQIVVNPKKYFLLHFEGVARFWVHINRVNDTHLQ